MAQARGANARLRAAFEATWGTPPATGFFELPFASCDIGANQPLETDNLLGQGREPQEPSRGDVDAGGTLSVPMDARAFGVWLKGLLGNPTTTGAGPYVHTFTSGAALLPSIASEIGNPEVPSYSMTTGLLVDSITMPFPNTGFPNATVTMIGKGETVAAASAAGTPTVIALQRFSRYQAAVTREGAELGFITNAEITYANGLDRAYFLGGGGDAGAVDPALVALSGSITSRFANTILLDDAQGGAPVSLEFSYTIDATASLVITVPRVFLPRARRSIQGPGGIEATYNWQAARQDGGGPSMTAVLTNDQATY